MNLPDRTAPDIALLLTEANAAAARLRQRLAVPAEHDDLCHDLLVDLLRRLPAFDPNRGGLGAFAGHLLRNQANKIAARAARDRRATSGPLLSLDAENDGTSLAERLSADGLAMWYGARPDPATIDRRIDVITAIGELGADDRRLCVALASRSVNDLVAAGFGSRASLYRRLRDIRLELTAFGLGAAA